VIGKHQFVFVTEENWEKMNILFLGCCGEGDRMNILYFQTSNNKPTQNI